MNVFSFVISLGIGICLLPYLINHLGRSAYGFIPIAGMLTHGVHLISQSIALSVNRFLTIAIQRDDPKEANEIFSTAFFSYVGLGLAHLLVFTVIIQNVNSFINVPDELYTDAIILLSCSAITFSLNLTGSIFQVPFFAYNRIDIIRSVDIGRLVVRTLGIISLFFFFSPMLRFIGYVDLSVSIGAFILNVVIGKKLVPFLKIDIRLYDWKKIHDLVNTGGWLLLNSLGVLLFTQTDVWVCNMFVGINEAGEYAALFQITNLLRRSGMVMITVLAPMIMIYYARSELDNLTRLCKNSVRMISLVLVIPISLVCVFSPLILKFWFGETFVQSWPLLVIMVSPFIFNLAIMPVIQLQVASNFVKVPALVTVFMGIGNLATAIFFSKYLEFGVYGVASVRVLFVFIKNIVFTSIYGAVILKQPWHTFLTPLCPSMLFLAIFTVISGIFNYYFKPTSLIYLSIIMMILGIIGLGFLAFILTERDRKIIYHMVPARFHPFFKRYKGNCK
ncbi:MAG: hypothetical protein D3925_01100 [Candidatus Electrothrix sp. AR5]|nr:hypothetical protein [Candidatus Electrothrix sp. AR5]